MTRYALRAILALETLRPRCSRASYFSNAHPAPKFVATTTFEQKAGRNRKRTTIARKQHLCERCAEHFAEWHKLEVPT